MSIRSWHPKFLVIGLLGRSLVALIVICVGTVSGIMFVGRYRPVWLFVMTRHHNSVRAEGGIWTMSPLVVVEGPVFVVVGLMLRMAHGRLLSLF